MVLQSLSVIITGAGSGIGREIAIALAKEGARLTLVGRRAAELDATARLVAEAGGQASTFAADIADYAQHVGIVGAARSAFGRINGLINNGV